MKQIGQDEHETFLQRADSKLQRLFAEWDDRLRYEWGCDCKKYYNESEGSRHEQGVMLRAQMLVIAELTDIPAEKINFAIHVIFAHLNHVASQYQEYGCHYEALQAWFEGKGGTFASLYFAAHERQQAYLAAIGNEQNSNQAE